MTSQILFLILAIIIVLVAVFLIGRHGAANIYLFKKINEERKRRKEEAKNKILELLKSQGKIYNRDVEKLLSMSNATAINYLEELENEEKIIQNGEVGRGVFYTRAND